MIVTTTWMRENYRKFNNMYWDGKLPMVEFKTTMAKKRWGSASYRFVGNYRTIKPICITMSNYFDSPESVKCTTLLHEMIHVADYVFNPHHFVFNGRKVRNYDSHGEWFRGEARRLAKDGWQIEKFVQQFEKEVSSKSVHANTLEERHAKNMLVYAVFGPKFVWWGVTNRYYVPEVKRNIRRYDWNGFMGGIEFVKFYEFTDPSLSHAKCHIKSLRGWDATFQDFDKKLNDWNAVEYDYVDCRKCA